MCKLALGFLGALVLPDTVITALTASEPSDLEGSTPSHTTARGAPPR